MVLLKNYRRKTAREFFSTLSKKLEAYDYNSALLDIDVLLEACLKKNRAWILSNGEKILNHKDLSKLNAYVSFRKKGKPIAYILNEKEFYGFSFFVDERVLIPKSDTEILVEKAFEFCSEVLKSKLTQKDFVENAKNEFAILDLCSGSACIGIAIVKTLCNKIKTTQNLNKPKIILTLQDISHSAMQVARINVERLLKAETETGLVKVEYRRSDLRLGLTGNFDCIVANPPYVPTSTSVKLLQDGRSEPLLALDGGFDGLELFPDISSGIAKSLKDGGAFFVEAGEYNIEKAFTILQKQNFQNLKIHFDLNGMQRVISGKL
ncbi:MAG: peptide chain release factor N(5)-glutamine methyltransferase [Treponemataceae bacterium]